MKKLLIGAGLTVAALMIFYGAVSAMVNQGNSLTGSLVTFVLVVAGASALVWAMKSDEK